MLNTPGGVRFLKGAEWLVFREALTCLREQIEDNLRDSAGIEFFVEAFDKLQPPQQLALLAEVADALSDETVPPPVPTVEAEAAIAAVFNQMRAQTCSEVDQETEMAPEKRCFWRRLLLQAYRETEGEPDPTEEPLPEESCRDFEEWDGIIDCMEERVHLVP